MSGICYANGKLINTFSGVVLFLRASRFCWFIAFPTDLKELVGLINNIVIICAVFSAVFIGTALQEKLMLGRIQNLLPSEQYNFHWIENYTGTLTTNNSSCPYYFSS